MYKTRIGTQLPLALAHLCPTGMRWIGRVAGYSTTDSTTWEDCGITDSLRRRVPHTDCLMTRTRMHTSMILVYKLTSEVCSSSKTLNFSICLFLDNRLITTVLDAITHIVSIPMSSNPNSNDIEWRFGFHFCTAHFGVIAERCLKASEDILAQYSNICLEDIPDNLEPITFSDPSKASEEHERGAKLHGWLIRTFRILAPKVEDIWTHIHFDGDRDLVWDERDMCSHIIIEFASVRSPVKPTEDSEYVKGDKWPGELPPPGSNELEMHYRLFGKPAGWYGCWADALSMGLRKREVGSEKPKDGTNSTASKACMFA
ncbi:hypothetical protein C8Q80DRAFT_754438 [Daedaleopsis nitida]|nr:hypothetical protein C8Q80DRAFT_754438 [Daedaleopsis nitida]